MKKPILYLFAIFSAFLFGSCEKELMPYEGGEGVYFAVRHGQAVRLESSWPYQPYTNVDFVRISSDEAEIKVKVAITGPVKDYDRTFYVEVNPDSTTAIEGTDYLPFQREWTLPAGAIDADVTITTLRGPGLTEAARTLGLRLVPSPDFELAFPEWDAIPSLDGGTIVEEFDASLHSLYINDIMTRPEVWSGSIQAGNVESGLFGVFTRRKMEFMIEHLGVTYEDFSSPELMPMPRMMLLSKDGAAILLEKFLKGEYVLEEDGRLMWMGDVPWKSIIGVPYEPEP